MTAAGQILIKDVAFVSYRGSRLEQTDFGSACPASGPSVNHYRFEYSASGLTCQAQNVLIKACANAACTSLSTDPSTITFTASTPTPSNTATNVTFTGSKALTLGESQATTVTMGMSAAAPSAGLQCYRDGALDSSCSYTLKDTGFIFVDQSTAKAELPTQIAGKFSDVGHNATTFALQAVQYNPTSGACSALFKDGVDVPVELAYECTLTPVLVRAMAPSCAIMAMCHRLPSFGSYSTHNLRFGADSKALIALNYLDAGKIQLRARKSIALAPGKVTVMQGNSDPFVVRPFALHVDVPGNPGSADASGAVFKKAGETFDVTVSAVQYKDGQDANGDGKPDAGVDVSGNALTPSFGQEAVMESVSLSSTLVSPANGHSPALQNAQFVSFVGGKKSKIGGDGVTWSDVGVIDLVAQGDGNYLGSGENVVSHSVRVGRFVPHHFRLRSSSLVAACGNFSYMDQGFPLSLHLEAQNALNTPVLNYDSGSGLHGKASVALTAENLDSGQNLGARLSLPNLSWADGVINSTFTSRFSRMSGAPWLDGPYDSLSVGLQVNDGESTYTIDLIDSAGGGLNMNAGDSGNCASKGNCNALKMHAGVNSFRYGRLSAGGSYGPGGSALNVPLQTEYWDSNTFQVSTLDNCTMLSSRDLLLSGVGTAPFANSYQVRDLDTHSVVGSTTVKTLPPNTTSSTLTASGGLFQLVLNPPTFTAGFIGYTPLVVDATSYPWLQYDWNTQGQGPVDSQLPPFKATFGQFRSNDRVIYWRERF